MKRFSTTSLVAAFAFAMANIQTAGAADLNFTIQQVGPNVVASASGFVNTAGLNYGGGSTEYARINPSFYNGGSFAEVGLTTSTNVGYFSGIQTSFADFGSGSNTNASSGSGDFVGVKLGGTNPFIYLPSGYVSGSPLSGTATWNSTTLAGLGLTNGTYNFSWGSGSNAGTGVLSIGVPEPSTYALGAIATGLLAFVARRRKAKAV